MSVDREAIQPGDDVRGKRVTVLGLGRFGGGVGVTRWLAGQGAEVTVSDAAPPGELEASVEKLAGLNVTLHLGGHDEADVTAADLVVVNPAVPPDAPMVRAAEDSGVPWTTEINLFLRRCPCRWVGITGSVGKSTTTAMTGAILERRYTTHVGGNIGVSLLNSLPSMGPDDVAVLELSSFQLESLPKVGISPGVALVTNLSPNHLDRHGDMESYAAAKKNLFRFQAPQDVLILNRNDDALQSWADEAPGQVDWFDATDEPFDLGVPGEHNQANAQAAWAVGRAMGVSREDAAIALGMFEGLPHRLQRVAWRRGVTYYNDSKCTTPTGTIVALRAFDPRSVIVIVGGYDKGMPFDELAAELAGRAKAVLAIGDTADRITTTVEDARGEELPRVVLCGDLPEAVRQADELARPGEAVLLSPACASYDQFTNYEQRGERFVQLVRGQA
jgi:UDP-N-acetylmuramoylalanine--D-glutamate ligase